MADLSGRDCETAPFSAGAEGRERVFLFLQGPNGPFFSRLAAELTAHGAACRKIGFTFADEAEWRGREGYEAFQGRADEWPVHIRRRIRDLGVTDLVLYGDERPYHKEARLAAGAAVTVHCFEEGYLRPYWITYERGGVNGNSRLMGMSIAEIREAARRLNRPMKAAPAKWGSSLAHTFWSLAHHLALWLGAARYPNYARHRELALETEFAFYLRRLAVLPALSGASRLREATLRRQGKRYHLVLLQLAFDASIRAHSDYDSVAEFVEECVDAFFRGAPAGDKLVLKAHPFDDGRENLGALARRIAHRTGRGDRVIFLERGRLAQLLDGAVSAVTINSTSAHQALWRGLPVRAMGRAVFDKPGLTSRQPLEEFFRAPNPPDPKAYAAFRRFLLVTSQIEGSFYRAGGRRAAAQRAAPMMLAPNDPYDAIAIPKLEHEAGRSALCATS